MSLLVGLCVASIAGYPLVAHLGLLFGVEQRGVAISYRALVLGLSITSLLHYGIAQRRFVLNRLTTSILIFWVLYGTRIVHDTLVSPIFLARQVEDYWITLGLVTFVPMVGLMVKPTEATIAAIEAGARVAAFVAGVAVSLMGLFGKSSWGGRLGTDSLNPIAVGHLGVILLLLSLTWRVTTVSLPKCAHILARSATLVLGVMLLGMSGSIGPMVSAVVCIGCFVLASPSSLSGLKRLALAVVISAGFWAAVSVVEDIGSFRPISRISEMAYSQDRYDTVAERLMKSRNALQQFLESPITGNGLVERETGDYPHNIAVETLMATGLLGGALMIYLMVSSFASSIAFIGTRHAATFLALVYIERLVGCMFSGGLMTDVFWLSLTTVCVAPRVGLQVVSRSAEFGKGRSPEPVCS